MLRGLNRMREEYRPDAGLETCDRVLMAVAIILAIGCATLVVRRDSHFTRLAHERYAAEETNEPREMNVALAPAAIAVEGTIGRETRTRTTYSIVNRGESAESHLAFDLHPGLRVEKVSATCGRTRMTRRWERLGVDLASPLPPRGTCRVTIDVAGTADAPVFSFAGRGTFGARYRRWRDASKSIDLSDLSRSTFIPGVTRQRIALSSSDFAPAPRYSPWRVSNEPVSSERDTSSFVVDSVLPPSGVSLSLRVPDGFTVADSCGSVGKNRIVSRCTFAFGEFRLIGAVFTTVGLEGATLIHLPPHAGLARIHSPALGEAVTIAERAWPGLALTGSPVFVEQPIDGDGERSNWRNPRANSIAATGPVFLIPEWMFIRRQPLAAPQIAASMIAGTLRSRRPVPPRQRRFFDLFFTEIARARTGSGEQRSATIGARGPRPATDPLLEIGWGGGSNSRLQGVLADLEYRVGAERLREGVNEFVSRPGTGTAKELLDILGRRAGLSLDNFYRDYFRGNAVPKLTIENAAFRREGNRWIVRATARNLATGEVICPVVLRTKFGSVRDVVRIDEGESVPIVLTSEHEPRTLQLDPEHVVYRHAAVGTVDSIDYGGGS
jgi:hypothetical protein